MVGVSFLIMVVLMGAMYTFGVFFKPLQAEFGWTSAMTSGAFSLYMILHGALYIVAGRLNDKYGPRIVMSVCGLFLGLGYLLMSQISTLWHLYIFYGVVVSIGMSGGFVPLSSTIARWFVKRRGLMTGVALAGIGVGTMLGPLVANWIIINSGWRISYMVIGITALVIITICSQFLRREPNETGQLPYGQDEIEGESLSIKAAGFSLREALSSRQFWLCCIVFFCFGIVQQTIMVHIVSHAIGLGISAAAAASIFIFIGGLSVIGRIVIGGFADRIGNKLSITICFILLTLVLLWLLVAKELWMLYLFAAIFGFAYGGLVAAQSPTIAELFGLSSHGTILGTIALGVTFGGAVGASLAGYIFDVTGSYQVAFLICTALGVVGIVLSWLLRLPSYKGATNELRTSP